MPGSSVPDEGQDTAAGHKMSVGSWEKEEVGHLPEPNSKTHLKKRFSLPPTHPAPCLVWVLLFFRDKKKGPFDFGRTGMFLFHLLSPCEPGLVSQSEVGLVEARV